MSPSPPQVKRFILDATDTAARLGGVSTRNDREAFPLTLKRGQEDYEALVERRQSLLLSPSEAAVVHFIMDGIQARLKFLEKQRSRSLPN